VLSDDEKNLMRRLTYDEKSSKNDDLQSKISELKEKRDQLNAEVGNYARERNRINEEVIRRLTGRFGKRLAQLKKKWTLKEVDAIYNKVVKLNK